MLAQLSIRNIVLIDRLNIGFSSGLSVLTGETGAGKSILLDALTLALGGRGDGALVRKGQDEGSVTAVFELQAGHPAFSILTENGIETDDAIILRRVQRADGRTKGYVNDAPVSAGLMRQLGELLVEIHGQHDDRAMLDPTSHLFLLDAHGGLDAQRALVMRAWENWRSVQSHLDELREEMAEAQREAGYLRASSEELQQLAPEEGEETELADRRQSMMKIEQIATDLSEANELLSGNGSPVTLIANLARTLERKRQQVPEFVDETLEFLDQALNALYSAQATLETAYHKSQFDPRELEQTEERLFALRAASRKFNVPVEHLAALAIKMADNLAMLDDGEERLAALEKEEIEHRLEYDRLANGLSEKRTQAAAALRDCVKQELPALKLENATFLVEQTTSDDRGGPTGIDQIEFWVQTNPGSNPGPMRKVASGGELSRFMLALKVALADRGSAPTLVFDEIDSGVGGAVADAIGQRLSRLSSNVQVLTVTHAPQVAARAATHFLISKAPDDQEGRVETQVEQISGEFRLEEVARMLSGATITDEARAAAAKLINPTAA